MTCIRLFFFVFLAFAVPAGAAEPSRPQDLAAEDQAQAALIGKGIELLKQHQPQAAITESFDKAIAAYEKKFRRRKEKIYAARTSPESLLYMLQAATGEKRGAIAVSWVWALGFYYKGYALNEMGKLAEAKTYLDRAIAMSPQNAQFLLERANIDLKEKKLQTAFDAFKAVADSAAAISPPESKDVDLARAWRGMGYVFVEQNKLDEAEKIYLRCLNLNKDDRVAAGELQYVRDLKMKAAESRK